MLTSYGKIAFFLFCSSLGGGGGRGSMVVNAQDFCQSRLIALQSGRDSTCDGGALHYWPIDYGPEDCHGWEGNGHFNSAKNMKCNSDGSFTFTQYAGNTRCEGSGVVKTAYLNQCEQDIPPTIYTKGVDLECCLNPDSEACNDSMGYPRVTVPNSVITMNGQACGGDGDGSGSGGGDGDGSDSEGKPCSGGVRGSGGPGKIRKRPNGGN